MPVLLTCSIGKGLPATPRQIGFVKQLRNETGVFLDKKETEFDRLTRRQIGTQQCVYVQHHDPERTVLGKKFLSLPGECDSLEHAVNHIKHAQRLCARRTPGLWRQAKGINDDIVVKTARFIVNMTRKQRGHVR